MGSHSCYYKQKLRKALWPPEEDEELFNCIIRFGLGFWSSVPQHARTYIGVIASQRRAPVFDPFPELTKPDPAAEIDGTAQFANFLCFHDSNPTAPDSNLSPHYEIVLNVWNCYINNCGEERESSSSSNGDGWSPPQSRRKPSRKRKMQSVAITAAMTAVIVSNTFF